MNKFSTIVHTNNAEEIAALYQKFSALNQAEQTLMMILSAVYKPIGMKKLDAIVDILVNQGFLTLAKKDYRLSITRKDALLEQEILSYHREGLFLNRLLCNRLCQDMANFTTSFDAQASLPATALENKHPETKEITQQNLLTVLQAAEEIVPVVRSLSWQDKLMDQRRIVRDYYLLGRTDRAEQALDFNKNPQDIDYDFNLILIDMLFVPFELDSFLRLPQAMQYQAFATLIRRCQIEGQNSDYATSLLEQVCAKHADVNSKDYNLDCQHLLAEQYLYQLRLAEFEKIQFSQDASCYGLQLRGAYAFLSGQNQQAIDYFELAIKAKNKYSRRKNQYLSEILGYFYKLALIIEGNKDKVTYYARALEQIDFEERDRKSYSDYFSLGKNLRKPIESLLNGGKYNVLVKYSSAAMQFDHMGHLLDYLNFLLAQVWCNQSKEPEHAALAREYHGYFESVGYALFSHMCAQLLAYFKSQSTPSHPPVIDLTQQIKSKSRWDVALDKLIALNPKAEAAATPAAITESKPIRLIWELDTDYGYRLHPREQKQTKSGWSKGRHVALKRLCEEPDQFTYMSESDKTVCRAIEKRQGWGYYAKTEYSLEGLRALEAAAGIDNLYHLGEFDAPIDLVRREPELMVSQQGEELCLSIAEFSDDFIEEAADGFSERPTRHRGRAAYSLRSISDSRYQLTVFSPEHLKVGEIIGETGLLIPISAKQKALDGISAIAPFLNIQSDIAELDTGLATVECDNHLVVNIQPTQHGLAFTCVVMPFGEAGPAYTPGLGNASLSAEIKGKRLATQRDLLREEDLLDQLDEHCPAFLAMSGNSLVLEDFQASLAALEQLENAFNQSAFELLLRWPKGKKISLTKKLGSEQLQLALGKQNEWFDISGNLAINDEEVIELRKLLGLLSTSNGRFIELGKDQILALSDELRQKLELINQVSDEGKFHPLASLQIEQAVSGMRMKTLHAWDQQTLKMREANSLAPKLPSTFQAQLRDYQLVGFDWASRLAHWGAGACLADDMGLGKTLQALAVILSRAQDGPSLVIAPTSVCFNWHQEAVKFSPTLNIKLFADSVTTLERGELLKTLQPFDCVIISYGLLQRESELLAQVQWRTIVADEAQALKNPTAKRTKAAYALKGDFKMITTGTPIENDLTELWSLFRFINPGLLGNLKRFAQRFAIPIENAKDNKLEAHKAQQGLKTLIQPFMLRRMKNQVLTELPPRTEINIQVEMAPKEKAFYEALRLNAIDNITQSSTTNAGEQRIKMLAELVKLRQACCNSKLVIAESDIPSAKLAALDELLEELKLNNHKALIFSQFVGHLQLIKQHLERKGFSYQYLDGSTPQKDRQKRVNAFQSGDGDVFLISLKAGGSGLNLTAADYVIHMDPWWNPAVEEQASDRAHRMGQTRPVTIYRLITQHTIEEKIVALHQHKRDLADKLLSGNETVSKLSVEDMLNLLKDTF